MTNKFKVWLCKKGISQSEMAQECEVSIAFMNRFLNASRVIDALKFIRKIEIITGNEVTLKDIVDGDESFKYVPKLPFAKELMKKKQEPKDKQSK